MNITNMKNIVVLKNLPSNIVEEAIVVLKENTKIKKYQYIDKNNDMVKNNKNKKDYIVKEAEMVISNYISDMEKQKNNKKNVEIFNKYNNLKKITIFLSLMLFFDLIIKLIF